MGRQDHSLAPMLELEIIRRRYCSLGRFWAVEQVERRDVGYRISLRVELGCRISLRVELGRRVRLRH
jgi:hypothetical protein